MMDELSSDIFILGCGRSGTSLAAGLLHSAGFFVGSPLLAPTPANPKGFFQDSVVTELNDEMIGRYLPPRPRELDHHYGWDIPRKGQRWLARLNEEVTIVPTNMELQTIRQMINRTRPFCLKDPRFCYTIDAWRLFANSPKFICTFRHPSEFVTSVYSLSLTDATHVDLAISVDQLLDVWVTSYKRILSRYAQNGSWLIIEYDELVNDKGIDRLQEFVGTPLRRTFVDRALQRSQAKCDVTQTAERIYQELRNISKVS
jgi:hypothetical protein